MPADLQLHMTPDDNVALLPLVGCQVNRATVGIGAEFQLHIQRQRNTVAEAGGQVITDHTVSFLDSLTFALAGEGIGTQLGAVAFQKVAQVNTQNQGAAIQKGDI